MAQLGFNGQGFDATKVDPTDGFPVLQPQTDVVMQVINSSMKNTKDYDVSKNQFLDLEIDLVTGQDTGRKIFKKLNLVNRNAQAQKIAEKELSQICHATGRLNIVDSEQLHFAPFVADIVVIPAKGNYGPSNDIKNLRPYQGAAPQQQQGYAPQPQQQPPQQGYQQHPAAGGYQQPQQQYQPAPQQQPQQQGYAPQPAQSGAKAPWHRG